MVGTISNSVSHQASAMAAPVAATVETRAVAEVLTGGRSPNAVDLLPWLPCVLALEVAVVGFTVSSLLNLQAGSLVQTSCHQSMDIPLLVNGMLMARSEFEVIGERLAARITDLV